MDELAKRGFEVHGTREDDITPITVPLNMDERPLHGKMQITVEMAEEIKYVQDLLDGQAYVRHNTPYRIRVSVYCLETDSTVTFEKLCGLDIIPAAVRDFDEQHVIVKWKRR